MRGMKTTPQTPAPTTFDSTGLAEQLAATITSRIAETFDTDGIVEQTAVRSAVDTHLKHALRSLADEGLMLVLEDVHQLVAAARTRDEQLLADPRYAEAPVVTGTLAFQQWAGYKEDQLMELRREDVVLPAAWLARQDRGQLQHSADEYVDKDWIVEDLGLLGEHQGPFELEIDPHWESDQNLLELWLEATEQ